MHFPEADKIVLVQDNLSTHTPASLYAAFPPAEARRLVERFEWHYTPKHGSWLNMAEGELALGGIRWGLVVKASAETWSPYALSVVPSLVAWAALAAPEPWRLVILGLVALALGPIDLELIRGGAAPAWFGRLRLILSTGAGVALLLAAWG